MTWWCSANGTAWNWAWQAYPGVWVLVTLLAWTVWRRSLATTGVRVPMAAVAILAIWAALDWPIGRLGSGYLLSIHQAQYLLLVMIAPPLLLRADAVPAIGGLVGTVASWMTRPVQAIVICNALVVATHIPAVVDGLMPTQIGSFILDLSWLGAGLILWAPVVHPTVSRRLSYPGRFGYLLAATLVPGIPALFFFFADYPLYSTYELAPPVAWMPVMRDQFVAGILMKMGSFLIILVALSVVFYRWQAADRDQADVIILPGTAGRSNPSR